MPPAALLRPDCAYCIKVSKTPTHDLFRRAARKALCAVVPKETGMVRKSIFLAFLLVALTATSTPAAIPADFTALVKSAGPAVVNINTEKVVTSRPQRGPFPFPSPFDDFFRDLPGSPFNRDQQQQAPRQRKQRSLGSGFVISSDGYIVTNHHVVNGADSIQVSFGEKSGREHSYKATLVGSDKETDLALLKINATNLPFLKFGDSDALQVGEWLLAIGNPFGLDHTVTAGILSAKGRNIRSGAFDSFLQTDASINPGNSGGPLLNMNGEVIGINAAIIAGGQGIGFAIPSNMAKKIIAELRSDRKITRGWIGVTIQSLDENGAKALGLPDAKGALVGDVQAGNPAAKAGMQAGDVILKINGETVADSGDLVRKISDLKPGTKATVVVWRNGSEKELSLTLGERSAENDKDKSSAKSAPVVEILGLTVRPVASDEAGRLRLEKAQGLLVTDVAVGKSADEAGVRSGDVILGASGHPVNSVEDLDKVLENQGKERGAVMLYISRQGQKFFRTVEVAKK